MWTKRKWNDEVREQRWTINWAWRAKVMICECVSCTLSNNQFQSKIPYKKRFIDLLSPRGKSLFQGMNYWNPDECGLWIPLHLEIAFHGIYFLWNLLPKAFWECFTHFLFVKFSLCIEKEIKWTVWVFSKVINTFADRDTNMSFMLKNV